MGCGFPVRSVVDVGLCSSFRVSLVLWIFFYFLLSDGMCFTVSLKNVCFSQLHSIGVGQSGRSISGGEDASHVI